jgi:carbon storage regulator CsrA
MHIFTRKLNERVIIGDAVVTVIAISPTRVRLTVDAPARIAVDREEVHLRKLAERGTATCCSRIGPI